MRCLTSLLLAISLACLPANASRSFVVASSQSLRGGGLVQAVPCSIGFWIKMTSVTAIPPPFQTLFVLNDGTNAAYIYQAAGGFVGAVDGGGAAQVTSSNTISAGVWTYILVVFASTNSQVIYLNGTKTSASGAGGWNLSGANKSAIAQYWDGTLDQSFTGGLYADFTIWSVALTDEDAAAKLAGASSLRVRPNALVNYTPLVSTLNAANNAGAFSDHNGTTVAADEPRIYR